MEIHLFLALLACVNLILGGSGPLQIVFEEHLFFLVYLSEDISLSVLKAKSKDYLYQ